MQHNNPNIYYIVGRIMGMAEGLHHVAPDDLERIGQEISALAYSIVAHDLDRLRSEGE